MFKYLIFINLISYILLFSQDLNSTDFSKKIFSNLNSGNLYNERSLSKGNGFIRNGNVNINDYNGGLTYSYPIINTKIGAEASINVSLIYNNNLSAQSFNEFDKHGEFMEIAPPMGSNISNTNGVSNISSPGWILNVNGVAVQLFNEQRDIRNFTSTSLASQPTDSWFTPMNAPLNTSPNRIYKGWHYNFTAEKKYDSFGKEVTSSPYSYQIDILNGEGGIDSYRLDNRDKNGVPIETFDLRVRDGKTTMPLYNTTRSDELATLYVDYGLAQFSSILKYNMIRIEKTNGVVITYRIVYNMKFSSKDVQKNPIYQDSNDDYNVVVIPNSITNKDGSSIGFVYDIYYDYLVGSVVYDKLKPKLLRIVSSNLNIDLNSTFSEISLSNGKKYTLGREYSFDSKHYLINSITDPDLKTTKFSYKNYDIYHFGVTQSPQFNGPTFFNIESPVEKYFAHYIQHRLIRMDTVFNVTGQKDVFEYIDANYYQANYSGPNGNQVIDNLHPVFISPDIQGLNYLNMATFNFKTGRDPYNTNVIQTYDIMDKKNKIKQRF